MEPTFYNLVTAKRERLMGDRKLDSDRLQNPRSCLGSTSKVQQIRDQAIDAGLVVDDDPDAGSLVIAFDDGEPVYMALRIGATGGTWLVRYNTEVFE